MSWRTVVISNRCKLDLNMGYMVVRGEETKRVFLDEIAILIIENPAVSLTCCLLQELTVKKIRIIFCDSRRNPYGELQPYDGSHDCSLKIRKQIGWTDFIKKTVWTSIVAEKIRNQAYILKQFGHEAEYEMLQEYIKELAFYDETNREGHAAKVYFNSLFGMDFSRGQDDPINAALNYGYSLILSAFNREVTLNGYLTQLGLCHANMFNPYNLSCDLMEPFRPFVDREVLNMNVVLFEKEHKYQLVSMLHTNVFIDRKGQTMLNAIKIYTRSVFNAINNDDDSLIIFPEL